MLEKVSILNMLFFITFYSSKNLEKSITGYKLFIRDHVTPKTESNHFIRVMADENSALDHMNKLYFICFTDY